MKIVEHLLAHCVNMSVNRLLVKVGGLFVFFNILFAISMIVKL